jgi:hypothetical protein
MWFRSVLTAFALLLPCMAVAQPAGPAADPAPHVYSDAGNIFIEHDGAKTQLTKSEQDVDPVLSPDGKYVVYTRQGRARSISGYDLGQFCTNTPSPDQLRQVNIDGTEDKPLINGHKGDAEDQLCVFRNKQFSSDGRRLYFLSPAWTATGALHVYDTRTHKLRFLMPANDLLVLNFCPGEHEDDIVVEAHRYFVFGGSYDWYWLYDSTGKKELGPLGHFDNPDAVAALAHSEWCKE